MAIIGNVTDRQLLELSGALRQLATKGETKAIRLSDRAILLHTLENLNIPYEETEWRIGDGCDIRTAQSPPALSRRGA